MSQIEVFVDAVGVCGPGFANWNSLQEILRNDTPSSMAYALTPTVIAPPAHLPPAERRRVGTAVKLAFAAASDALVESKYVASDLLSVFSSSGGDGDNCHSICEALASNDRLISPTRFTNSVHNAPSGYWGIALKARPASTSLCAYDASFSVGLLESATQALAAKAPVLLVAYDTPYPEPLRGARPIAHSLGIALILSHAKTESSVASLRISLGKFTNQPMRLPALEELRLNVPAAKGLPLLEALAQKQSNADLILEMFDNQQLKIDLRIL